MRANIRNFCGRSGTVFICDNLLFTISFAVGNIKMTHACKTETFSWSFKTIALNHYKNLQSTPHVTLSDITALYGQRFLWTQKLTLVSEKSFAALITQRTILRTRTKWLNYLSVQIASWLLERIGTRATDCL